MLFTRSIKIAAVLNNNMIVASVWAASWALVSTICSKAKSKVVSSEKDI